MTNTTELIKIILIWSPIPFALIFYYVHHRIYRSRLRSIHFISEYTTILFIISSAILVKEMLGFSIIGYVCIILFLLLAIILIFQRKNGTEISLAKAMKLLMRMNFLLFSFIYIILIITYLINL